MTRAHTIRIVVLDVESASKAAVEAFDLHAGFVQEHGLLGLSRVQVRGPGQAVELVVAELFERSHRTAHRAVTITSFACSPAIARDDDAADSRKSGCVANACLWMYRTRGSQR